MLLDSLEIMELYECTGDILEFAEALERAVLEKEMPWITAIDEAMVIHHVGVADASDTYEQAKEKLNTLLCVAQDIGVMPIPKQDPVGYAHQSEIECIGNSGQSCLILPKADHGFNVPVFVGVPQAAAMPIPKQEPIYMWRLEHDGWMECTKEWFDADISSGYEKRIVYAHPLPAQAAAIPDGFQLVPIDPTYQMLSNKGCKSHLEWEPCIHHDRRKRTWAAMLSASPKP